MQKFANLSVLLGYMYGQPAKKLLFMGGEFGQWSEWYHEASLEWHLLDNPSHRGVQKWVENLNRVYRAEPSLHEMDLDPRGVESIDANDAETSVVSFIRKRGSGDDIVLVVCNFTPVARHSYRVGVPRGGYWRELLNSDGVEFGGSGQGTWVVWMPHRYLSTGGPIHSPSPYLPLPRCS